MNKNAIQKFAIWARKELIAQVSQRAYQYGIDESGFGDASADTLNGRLLTAEEKSQRQELIGRIMEKGYKQVMEEVAYTWFNRFIALRFMEVNNYLPSHIRVFSDSTGAFKPEILSDVLHLDLPGLNRGKVAEYIESNDTEGLYRYLLLTQCNALNDPLPRMFEKMGGYTELLLPNNILKQDSVLGHMVADIPEVDWTDQVQIIGWLYQFYNTEIKNEINRVQGTKKISKNQIPAATQLFTPDWIVRYMVENSLGRLWLEGHPNAELHDGWKYYLDEAEQEPEVEAQLAKLREEYTTIKPEEIKVIDPCMGSGHILVYAFDVLMQIYTSAGWDQREAAQSILENNLFGLDIDDRAAQLAYFAVMMKARQYDRRLLTRGIQPNVYSIRESNGIQEMTIEYFHKNDPKLKADIESIVTEMRDAKEYGSILNITPVDFAGLYARFDEIREDINMMQKPALEELLPVAKCAELLAQKYDVVVTNPPYMGSKQGMNGTLKAYLQQLYPNSKSDLYAVFMEVAYSLCRGNRYVSMINQHGWMFLSSYTKLREQLIVPKTAIINMLHLGTHAFENIGGEVVQTTTFTLLKKRINIRGSYVRLTNYADAEAKREAASYATMDNSTSNLSVFPMKYFDYLPDSLIGYWISPRIIDIFNREKCLSEIAKPRQGLSTSDNDRFLKLWHEPRIQNIGFGFESREVAAKSELKWFPYNKGGEYRKWYGNNNYVINWQFDGRELRAWADYLNTHGTSMGRLVSQEFYFQKGITWSGVGATRFGVRCYPQGMLFDVGANGLFVDDSLYNYLAGFLNTKIANAMIQVLNPTINTGSGTVGKLPIIISQDAKNTISELVEQNVSIARSAWDSYETSWDFKRNPLV